MYNSWVECHRQTSGHSNALFKSYWSESEAVADWTRYVGEDSQIQGIGISARALPEQGIVYGAQLNMQDHGTGYGGQPNMHSNEVHMRSLVIGFVAGILVACIAMLIMN